MTAAITTFARNFISGERKIRHRIAQLYGISDPQFERSMSQLVGPPILEGNLVMPLRNGVEIFPAMLAAIDAAERSITFETFIYWSGAIAQKFADALSAKARSGLKVHVLVDGVGCDCVHGPALRQMEEAGVQVEVNHISNVARANHRTHRKLLVIDGRVGFTGGVGIADQWDGNAASPNEWRDSHYRVEGPVVAQMQAAFLDNWMKTRAIVLHGDEFFPRSRPPARIDARCSRARPWKGARARG
ncbi:MAG: phospholipase D-like domain-containing protein [Chthoniobacterales bacterium]